MKYNPAIHHRRSIRLVDYDYRLPGAYFITLCANEHRMVFGKIKTGIMQLNQAGEIVREEWLRTAEIRKEVELDTFVVMPNHFHAIVWLVRAHGVRPEKSGRTPSTRTRLPQSLGSMVAGFKCVVTRRINEMNRTPGASVWLRNYYEHIIRNEEELNGVRQYIIDNPTNWDLDRNNPDAKLPAKIGLLAWEEI